MHYLVLSSDSGQIKAREAYSKFKFTIDMGVGQLQKTLLDSLSGWSVIGDNDKSNKVKLYDFYKQTRDKFPKQPDSHPIVRVRQMLADLIFNEAQILANVNLTIERIISPSTRRRTRGAHRGSAICTGQNETSPAVPAVGTKILARSWAWTG